MSASARSNSASMVASLIGSSADWSGLVSVAFLRVSAPNSRPIS